MKPTITEALQARIPLPWKQSTCDGPPQWKVERQRPEDFIAEIYQKLKKYGMKEDEIRNLFYIKNEDYTAIKQHVGVVAGTKTGLANWLADIAPKDRPKVEVDPAEDTKPHEPTDEEIVDVFRPEDNKPVPFVPVEPVEPEPPLQARIEIICNGATIYDLEQLHSTLMDFNTRKRAVVSGTLRIMINKGK